MPTLAALACALHALNEVSKGVGPRPAAAVLPICCPDGSVLGHADTQDAEILAKRVHEIGAQDAPEEIPDLVGTLWRQTRHGP